MKFKGVYTMFSKLKRFFKRTPKDVPKSPFQEARNKHHEQTHTRGVVYNVGYGVKFISYKESDKCSATNSIRIGKRVFDPVVYNTLEAIEKCIVRYAQSLPFTDLELMHKCDVIIDGTLFTEDM